LSMQVKIRQLTPNDLGLMYSMLTTFGKAFGDMDAYGDKRPSADYLRSLLASDNFVALAALKGTDVIGGLAAYELKKFEQERSEFYIYDLAVSAEYRRQGVATALIEKLKAIAKVRGAYVLFVQADTDVGDRPAIALYSKLGLREEVLHFDIPVESDSDTM